MEQWFRIETERLLLREIPSADEDDVHEYASDPLVSRYDSRGPNTREKTHEVVARWISVQQQQPRLEFNLAMQAESTIPFAFAFSN